MGKSWKVGLVAALAVVAGGAWAQEADGSASEHSGGLWVTSGFVSKHLSDSMAPEGGYNQRNDGIGVEYVVNDNWAVAGGMYRNSVRERSRYLQGVWSPDATALKLGEVTVKFGVAAGVVDGYPAMRNGHIFPTLLPVVGVTWKGVGLNLTYIPSVAGNVDGALALQLKLKVF